MSNNIKYPDNPRNSKAMAGIILLAIGAILLIQQFHFFFFPGWIFSWPMILIGLGLYLGAKSNFHKPSSFILIVLGVVFLINDNVNGAGDIVWPLGIIAFGLWLILRRHNRFEPGFTHRHENKWDWDKQAGQPVNEPVTDYTNKETPPFDPPGAKPVGDEYLDAVSVFGGVKKTIVSKNFRGGEVVNIFGGAELDFTQADITGRVIIDITQIFGSTKIIVPSHWQVVSDIAAVFSGIDDKRMRSTANVNNDKILVLKGVSIFAGIDIRSY